MKDASYAYTRVSCGNECKTRSRPERKRQHRLQARRAITAAGPTSIHTNSAAPTASRSQRTCCERSSPSGGCGRRREGSSPNRTAQNLYVLLRGLRASRLDFGCLTRSKQRWRWGESNPLALICILAGQTVFHLVRGCLWSFPSMPFESPGSRRTASNACRRVKSVSSTRACDNGRGQPSGAAAVALRLTPCEGPCVHRGLMRRRTLVSARRTGSSSAGPMMMARRTRGLPG